MIIEDRLSFEDEPIPQPAPRPATPQPSPVPVAPVVVQPKAPKGSPSWWTIAPWVGMTVMLVGILGYEAWKGRMPGPTPPTPVADGVTLGKTFIPKLAAALADGFEASDRFLSQGKTFKEANDILKQTFYDSRQKAYADHAGAAVTAIMPDGTEIKDDAQRAAIRKFEADFAKGLRGGK